MHSLGQRQQKYDQQVAKLADIQGTVSGYNFVGDAAQRDLKQVEDVMLETSQSLLKKDLSDPSVQGEVNQLINDISSSPKLKMHLMAAEKYKEYRTQYEDLAKKGKLADANIYAQTKAWERYKATGELDDMALAPIEEAVDIESENKKYFDMIKASGGDAIAYLQDGTAYKNGSKGVYSQDIRDAVDGALWKYSNSQAGRQLKREYEMYVAEGAIDPAKQSMTDYLRDSLLSTGKKYMWNQSSTNADVALRASQTRALKKAEETATELGYLPAFASPNAKIEVDKDGNVKSKEVGFFDLVNTFGLTTGTAMWFKGDHEIAGKEAREQTALLRDNAKKSGMTVQEYAEALNADPNIQVEYYVNKKTRDNESARIFDAKTGGGEFYTRKIYTPDYPTGISMQEYLKEEGVSEQEAKAGFTVIGKIKADNPYTPGGKAMMINGKQVIVDDAANADIGEVGRWKAMQAKYNGKGSVEFEHNGKTYKYVYNAKTGTVDKVK